MKNLIIFAGALWISTSVVFAQKKQTTAAQSNSITKTKKKQQKAPKMSPAKFEKGQLVELSVKVLNNQQADGFVAVLNLTQMAATVEATKRILTDRYKGFVQGAQTAGIPKENIQLETIGMRPVYASKDKSFSKTNNETPKAFEMQQNIYIRYQDKNKLAEVLFVAAQFEIFDLLRIDCYLQNQTTLLRDMQQQAIGHLVTEIELLQEKLGLDLESGYRVVAEKRRVFYPHQHRFTQTAEGQLSLGLPLEKGQSSDAYKTEMKHSQSIGQQDFDIVLQPDMLQPEVQLVYEMKIQVEIKDSNKASKEYFWLTPDGDKVPIK